MNIPNIDNFLAGYLAVLRQQHPLRLAAGDCYLQQLGMDLVRCQPLLPSADFDEVCSSLMSEIEIARWITDRKRLLDGREADSSYDEPYLDDSMVALADVEDSLGNMHLYTVDPSMGPGYFHVRY